MLLIYQENVNAFKFFAIAYFEFSAAKKFLSCHYPWAFYAFYPLCFSETVV